MGSIRGGKMTVEEAATSLGITQRRVNQLYGHYLKASAEGLQAEWEPGRSGGNHRPKWPEAVVELLSKLLGADPPLSYSFAASEVLRRLGVRLDRATVRRWALEKKIQPKKKPQRKPAAVRRWQCSEIGSLWQLDSSPHHWFGDQGPLLPLLDMIDDCSRVITGARIYPSDTLPAYLDFLPRTFEAYGLPLALYVDYHKLFFHDHPEALTQLASALKFYGISLRYAPTPQAKGKIERGHLFWQNRLPSLFMLERVAEISAANELLEMLRTHHNEQEIHREIQMTPSEAWQKALDEKRSVLRPAPRCPWWPYVWSIRTPIKVGSDGRVAVGSQRLRIELPPHTRVIRCLHPSGAISILRDPPDPAKLPQILLQYAQPQKGNFDRTKNRKV